MMTCLFDEVRQMGVEIKAIYCDTRQKDKKHDNIEDGFRRMGIEPIRTKLYVGDYSLPLDQRRVIDTKQGLQEVAGNLCQQHKRFAEECDKAAALGIELIILIEENGIKSIEDVPKWYNWRTKKSPKAVDGKKLYSIMKTFEEHHGCRFEFCEKGQTAQRIVEILVKNEGE